MVPSWTETLIECGTPVTGRTRFCIHPKDRVRDIPVVGGTKDIDWDKVYELSASMLILDQEENPKEMAEESHLPYIATHVTRIEDMASECEKLARHLGNEQLRPIAERWRDIEKRSPLKLETPDDIPGVMEWIKKPEILSDVKKVYYVIWKDPWMFVSKDTFIGSMLTKTGLGPYLPESDYRYPTFEIEDIHPRDSLVLFSSEPYPFHRKKDELMDFPFKSAIVNGECFSWFGIRSLQFLEKILK